LEIHEAQLSSWEQTEQAATPGPWRWGEDIEALAVDLGVEIPDALFIPMAREAMPLLLQEVRRLQARVKVLESQNMPDEPRVTLSEEKARIAKDPIDPSIIDTSMFGDDEALPTPGEWGWPRDVLAYVILATPTQALAAGTTRDIPKILTDYPEGGPLTAVFWDPFYPKSSSIQVYHYFVASRTWRFMHQYNGYHPPEGLQFLLDVAQRAWAEKLYGEDPRWALEYGEVTEPRRLSMEPTRTVSQEDPL